MLKITGQLLPNAHSYATRERAEKQVLDALDGAPVQCVQWFIIAQDDGRFTPCVRADLRGLHYFMGRKISVI